MLKTALLIVAAASSSSTSDGGGCSFCGHYNGEGDQVYRRGTEQLVVCANGGIVANLASQTIEGTLDVESSTHGRAFRDGTDELAFELVLRDDATAVTPELGMTPWTYVDLDKTALDHADVLCTDLEARDWWQ